MSFRDQSVSPTRPSVLGLPVPVERFINRRELADLLGVSLSTVDSMVREGCPSGGGGGRVMAGSDGKAFGGYPESILDVPAPCGHPQRPFGPGDGCELAATRTCRECGALLWWTEQAGGGNAWEFFL